MKQCKRCDMLIMDHSSVCPLCHSVLTGEGEGEDAYPSMAQELQRTRMLSKIFYFSLILIGALSAFINYLTFSGLYWSVIVLAGIGYCWFTVSYTAMHRTNLGAKVIWQALGIIVLTVIIDVVTGYKGWSIRYAVPGLLLLANLALVIMMMVNPASWQGYFMCQIAVTFLSILPLVAAALGFVDNMLIAIITCGVSFLVLIGIIIFLDRKVKNELKRRFHT
ncbi:MAG: DUF6320 domain-containing protein [Lachnospiraceae bacterium]|nr:DUF6320 domain-containing protein [Lachnospiraceae bacterium]